jgi:HK97 family phage major capsid protein
MAQGFIPTGNIRTRDAAGKTVKVKIRSLGDLASAALKGGASERTADAIEFAKDADTLRDVCERAGIDISAIKVDDLFAKRMLISIDSAAPDEVVIDGQTVAGGGESEAMGDEMEDQDMHPARKGRGVSQRALNRGVVQDTAPRVLSERQVMSRRYDNAVKNRTAVRINGQSVLPGFASADQAELLGAHIRSIFRQGAAQSNGAGAHSVRGLLAQSADDDKAILENGRSVLDAMLGQRAHIASSPSLGGALVPTSFSTDLLDFQSQYGAVKAAAGTIAIDGPTEIPRRRSNTTAAFLDEGSAQTAQSNPTFDKVMLTPREIGAYHTISNTLLRYSPINIAEVVARDVRVVQDKFVDDWFLLGNNDDGITDLFTAAGTDHFDNAGSAWADWTVSDVETALGLIPSAAWAAGKVAGVMHRSFYHSVLRAFGPSAGGATYNEILGGVGRLGQNVVDFSGIPVYLTDSMPSAFSANQIVATFGSWASVLVGEVDSLEISVSEHAAFANNSIAYRSISRVAKSLPNVGGTATDGSRTLLIGLKD